MEKVYWQCSYGSRSTIGLSCYVRNSDLTFYNWAFVKKMNHWGINSWHIRSKFSEDSHELKILQDGQKVFSAVNCKSCLTISDIERAGRLAGEHMASMASKSCCISKDHVLGLKSLQYSTNSTTFKVVIVLPFHPGFSGATIPFCRNFERIIIGDSLIWKMKPWAYFLILIAWRPEGNYFFPLWNRGNVACHRCQLTMFQYYE